MSQITPVQEFSKIATTIPFRYATLPSVPAPVLSLSTLPTELRLEIFKHVSPKGSLCITSFGDEEFTFRVVLEIDGVAVRPSLSFLRISRQIYEECKDLVWKEIIINLDEIIMHRDTIVRTVADKGIEFSENGPMMRGWNFDVFQGVTFFETGPWAMRMHNIVKNARAVNITLDLCILDLPSICYTLCWLVEWPQLKRIQFSLPWDVLRCKDRFRNKTESIEFWTTIGNFFQDGGDLSHITRKLDFPPERSFGNWAVHLGSSPEEARVPDLLFLDELRRVLLPDISDNCNNHDRLLTAPENNMVKKSRGLGAFLDQSLQDQNFQPPILGPFPILQLITRRSLVRGGGLARQLSRRALS